MTDVRGRPAFQERLGPPWWMYAGWVVLAGSLGLTYLVVVGPLGALALGLVLVALGALALRRWAALVEVRHGQLRAGRARIPVALTGRAVALDAERAAWARGPGIDARAYHLLRGWVPTAVLVEVSDPADPTPYWYVSTRRPAELVAALERERDEPAVR